MLDRPTWDALQVMFERDGRASGTRRGNRKYLLTGLIRCGVCGARMNGAKTPRGYVYTCGREEPDTRTRLRHPHRCGRAGDRPATA